MRLYLSCYIQMLSVLWDWAAACIAGGAELADDLVSRMWPPGLELLLAMKWKVTSDTFSCEGQSMGAHFH